jgi:glycosyltransferase involved in cell wall biosynthesis
LWDSFTALKWASQGSISTSAASLAEMTISMLRGQDGRQRKEYGKLMDWLVTQPPPDIVSLPTSLLIALAKPLRQALGRPVICTLQGEDIFIEGLQGEFDKSDHPRDFGREARQRIAAHAEHVDAFIAVSDYYADFMAGYLGIPREKIQVVPLGINLAGHEPRPPRQAADVFRIGSLARIAPEKGLKLLCETYVELRKNRGLPPSRLEAAGYLGGDRKNQAYLNECRSLLEGAGLGGEFHYHGTLDRDAKIRFLQSLDVCCVPCPYPEPKGFPVLEAMANGVPVVQPRSGAFPEILEKTGGGILVEPDSGHFAEGILRLWKDPALREELGAKGAQGVRRHYSVARMAFRAVEVYQDILNREKKGVRQ